MNNKPRKSHYTTAGPKLPAAIIGQVCTVRIENVDAEEWDKSLLINVGTQKEANTLVLHGMLQDKKLKLCKIFHSKCNVKYCFKCYHYSHIAMMCRKLQMCKTCANDHA